MRIIADSEMGKIVLERARGMVQQMSPEECQNEILTESLKLLDSLPRNVFLGAMQIALDSMEKINDSLNSYPKDADIELVKWPIFATGLVAHAFTMTGVATQALQIAKMEPGNVYDPQGIANYIQYTALTVLGTQILAAAAYDMYTKLDKELGGNIEGIANLMDTLSGIAAETKPKSRKRPKKDNPFPSKLDV